MTVDPHPQPLAIVEWVGGPYDGLTFYVGAGVRSLLVELPPGPDDLLPPRYTVDIERADDGRLIAHYPQRKQP